MRKKPTVMGREMKPAGRRQWFCAIGNTTVSVRSWGTSELPRWQPVIDVEGGARVPLLSRGTAREAAESLNEFLRALGLKERK